VKRGAKGALVYQQDGQPNWVPAYESAAVFKIGSGDVFSAAFSFYWGEARLDAVAAANLASKSTATYCASRVLPLADVRDRPELRPVGSNHLGAVVIVGSANTLGARWLLEEAKSCIAQLGAAVVVPELGDEVSNLRTEGRVGAVLVLADILDERAKSYAVERKIASGQPDYWDYATRLELAVLDKNQSEANRALSDALSHQREAWEAESSL
jgi:hypothetical protein